VDHVSVEAAPNVAVRQAVGAGKLIQDGVEQRCSGLAGSHRFHRYDVVALNFVTAELAVIRWVTLLHQGDKSACLQTAVVGRLEERATHVGGGSYTAVPTKQLRGDGG
jgi:hypothetical protein